MPNLPSLGSKAPDFKANTTNGPIRLSDYKGNWIVLLNIMTNLKKEIQN